VENQPLALSNRENARRLSGLLEVFRNSKKVLPRRSMAASLAAAQFDRTPGAQEISLAVEALRIPSLTAARHGAKANWVPVYTASFRRRT
jgi:hypothetical protein